MGGFGGGVLGTQNWPNFNSWLQNTWGSGASYETVCSQFYGASNFVFGQNPPYYLDNFKSIYPKFFGLPTPLSGCGTTQGDTTITVLSIDGLDYGQFVQAPGILPQGSIIVGLGDGTVTLNNAATVTNANATIQTYQASPIPNGVILMYLRLAYESLVWKRWQGEWWVAMGLFIAHYCTLYAQTDASEVYSQLQTAIHGEAPTGAVPGTVYTLSAQPPNGSLQTLTKNGVFQTPGIDYTLNGNTVTMTNATVLNDALYATWPISYQTIAPAAITGSQIAAAGLAGGIQTSKSVGDVSVGYQALVSLENWGAWNLTKYGQILATMAAVVGMGPALIW